jgi:hypothetical protein
MNYVHAEASTEDPTAHDRTFLDRSTEADPHAARILGRRREPQGQGTDGGATSDKEGHRLDPAVIFAVEGAVRLTVLQAQHGIQRLTPRPITVWIFAFSRKVSIEPVAIGRTVALTVLIPFALGLIIRRLGPTIALRASPLASRVGIVLLVAAFVPVIITLYSPVVTRHVAPCMRPTTTLLEMLPGFHEKAAASGSRSQPFVPLPAPERVRCRCNRSNEQVQQQRRCNELLVGKNLAGDRQSDSRMPGCRAEG